MIRTNPVTGKVTTAALCIAGALAAAVSMAAESLYACAHEIPCRAGESRQVGFGSCTKGACANRTCWSSNKQLPCSKHSIHSPINDASISSRLGSNAQ